MKKSVLTLAAAICALFAAAALPGTAAAIPSGGGSGVTVTISAPAANAFKNSTPNLSFSTTGTGVTTTCTLTSGGVVQSQEEACSSGWNPGPLADGAYTYSVQAESADGMDSASRSFTIDQTAPVVTTGGSPAAGASNGSVIQVTGSTSDANPAFFNCRIDENSWGNCVGGAASSGGFDLVNVAEGTHTYWFAATDKAGNIGYASRTVTLDRTPPVATISGSGFSDQTRDNSPAFLTGATDAFSAVAQRSCSIDGAGAWQPCNGSTWLFSDGLVDGTYTARIDAVDAAGNHGTASTTFTVDATLPQITYGGFTDDRTTERSPDIELWATDAHAVTVQCAYDAADWDSLAGCDQGSGHVPAQPLALGQHQFWIAATDSYGNTASAIYSFEVVDAPPAGQGGDGGQQGQNGGPAAGVPKVALKLRSGKVKRGRFAVRAVVALTPATLNCSGRATVTITPRAKKAKPVRARAKLAAKNGICTGTANFKLPAKLKKQKAALGVSHPGNPAFAAFTTVAGTVRL